MKKVIGLLFAGVLAIQISGCCSITTWWNGDYNDPTRTGKFRTYCFVLGNLAFGPLFPIGMIIDWQNGSSHTPRFQLAQNYDNASDLEDGDPRKLMAVHLSDGTVAILKDVHQPTTEERKKARRLPQGVSVVKTEWVMRKAGT